VYEVTEWGLRWFRTHWLALIVVPLFVFTLLPFLAPVFMQIGWTKLGEWIYTLYVPLCHQLPQRSWFLFGRQLTYTLAEIGQVYPSRDVWQLRFFYGTADIGWKVAWSDRMISFYGMLPLFGLVYGALRKRVRRPLSLRLFILMLMSMAVDGVSHAISDMFWGISNGGFRDTNAWLAALTGNRWPDLYAGDHLGTFNWWLRLLSGILAAEGVIFFTFPRLETLIRFEGANRL
jgi:uncharacterized membrane protein